ncbi:MAG: hypothetical protein WB678_19040 [Stellaceae bacterium]
MLHKHPSQSLAENATPVLVEIGRGERLVEGIGLGPAPLKCPVEAVAEGRARGGGGTQSQAHACRATGRNLQPVVRRSLGADCRRINGVGRPCNKKSSIPSLTKRLGFSLPNRRRLLVSLSVKSSSGEPPHSKCQTPSSGWRAAMAPPSLLPPRRECRTRDS